MSFKIAQSSRIFQSLLWRGRILNCTASQCSTAVTSIAQVNEEKQKYLALLKEELPKPYDGPERDLVNFPRRIRLDHPGKLRMGFLPDEWFQFFYKKTGVTGPYLFGTGLLTFLLSKEYYVIEDELSTGVAMFLLIYICIKKFGPAATAWSHKLHDDENAEKEGMRVKNMEVLDESIKEADKVVWQTDLFKSLVTAKRENVQMQLETEYRKRMMQVYTSVKKRLDYFMQLDTTRKQMEQAHMIDWVLTNVMKSITPQQEKDALQKCLADLKGLAAKA